MDENEMNYHGKNITASEYYYNCNPNAWDNMLYPEAIKNRKEMAWKLFGELFEESKTYPLTQELPIELTTRMRKVKKAYDDNTRLVDEKSLVL